jgi:hypothetical protein
MKDLNLPKFNVPELPPKPMSFAEYVRWNEEHWRDLVRSGRLEIIRNDKTREPVNARFELK